MLSSNLIKSKIPICEGGGGWWNQFPNFDAESKFAKKKKIFCEKFSKFSDKNWNGLFLGFEYSGLCCGAMNNKGACPLV